MLKITIHAAVDSMTLELEGRLAGPWVGELERCWRDSTSTKPEQHLRVNLAAVTYIDSDGKALLGRMYQSGAELVAAGCLTRCIVEEITRAGQAKKPATKRSQP